MQRRAWQVAIAATLCALIAAGDAAGQGFLVPVEEIAARAILEKAAVRLGLTEGEEAIQIFKLDERAYLREGGRLHEVRGRTLDEILGTLPRGERAARARQKVGIYGEDLPPDFLGPTKPLAVAEYDLFRHGGAGTARTTHRILEIAATSGRVERVVQLGRGERLFVRVGSGLDPGAVLRRLEGSALRPSDIHVLTYLEDSRTEEVLRNLDGIAVDLVPSEQPRRILDALHAARSSDFFVVMGHVEDGAIRIRGSTAPGLPLREIDLAAKKAGARVFVAGCEAALESSVSGPLETIYAYELAGRLGAASTETNVAAFLRRLEVDIAVDESLTPAEEEVSRVFHRGHPPLKRAAVPAVMLARRPGPASASSEARTAPSPSAPLSGPSALEGPRVPEPSPPSASTPIGAPPSTPTSAAGEGPGVGGAGGRPEPKSHVPAALVLVMGLLGGGFLYKWAREPAGR